MKNRKVRVAIKKITFLMHHQEILPDLKELAEQIRPEGVESDKIDRDSDAYLMGAYEAINYLIDSLKQKGPQIKE